MVWLGWACFPRASEIEEVTRRRPHVMYIGDCCTRCLDRCSMLDVADSLSIAGLEIYVLLLSSMSSYGVEVVRSRFID